MFEWRVNVRDYFQNLKKEIKLTLTMVVSRHLSIHQDGLIQMASQHTRLPQRSNTVPPQYISGTNHNPSI